MNNSKFLSLFFLSGFSFIQSSLALEADLGNELLDAPRFKGTLHKKNPDEYNPGEFAKHQAHQHYTLGKKYLTEGNRRDAKTSFKQALKIHQWNGKNKLKTYMALADCYYQEGAYKEERYYWRLAQALPDCDQEESYWCTLQIGLAYRNEGKHKNALVTLQGLLSKQIEEGQEVGVDSTRYQVGLSHEILGDHESALSFYQEILPSSPGLYGGAQYRIGKYLQSESKNDLALQAYKRALQDPEIESRLRTRALIRSSMLLQEDGKVFDSVLYLQEALKDQELSQEERGFIHYQLGLTHKASDRLKEAVSELQKARANLSPEGKEKATLGRVLHTLGKVYVGLLNDSEHPSKASQLEDAFKKYKASPHLLMKEVDALESLVSGNVLDQLNEDEFVLLPAEKENTVATPEVTRVSYNAVAYASYFGRQLAVLYSNLQDFIEGT